MTMTMDEMKKTIVNYFKLHYGFAPALKDIRPLETSGYGKNKYEFMAFHINGIGYTISLNYTVCPMIEKSEHYDIINEH